MGKWPKEKKKRQQKISDIGNRSSLKYKNRPLRPITPLPHTLSGRCGVSFFFFQTPFGTNHSLGSDWRCLSLFFFFLKAYLNSHTFYNEDFSVGFSAGYHLVLLRTDCSNVGTFDWKILLSLLKGKSYRFFLNFCLLSDRKWHYYIHTLKVIEQQQ